MIGGKLSAGLLVYRESPELEMLIAHPGGPFWRNKDEGAWSIPKGEPDPGEDLLDAAFREFAEETGFELARGDVDSLGTVTLRSGKVVHAWALAADLDPADAVFGTFTMKWTPGRGKPSTFPEIDRLVWATPEEARLKLNPAQAELVGRLLELVSGSGS